MHSRFSPRLTFYDADVDDFDFDLVFYARLNQAPQIDSLPAVEAIVDKPYRYQVTASDPDGDPLTYALVAAPAGVGFAAAAGTLTWTPTASDVGNYDVTLRVDDGRGGTSDQHYVLSVIEAPPNRPPVFTTLPVVEATVASESEALYGLVRSADSELVRIASPNGVPTATIVGSTGVANLADLAIGTSAAEGFAVNDEGLYAIRLSDGTSRFIGSTGLAPGLSGLEVLPDGRLLATHFVDSRLFELDPATGLATPLFDTGWKFQGDLAFDPLTNSVLALGFQGAQSSNTSLLRINLEAESVELVGLTGQQLTGLAVASDGRILAGGANSTLWAIDRSTGHASAVGDLGLQFGAGLAISRPAPSYTYDADAVDPDFDAVTYALLDGPSGMTVDPQTGVVTWAPTAADLEPPDHQPVDPSLPIVPGFDVGAYADVTDPVRLTVDDLGNLFVGRDNRGSGGGLDDAVKIHRVLRDAAAVSEYGAVAISDPDEVVFDATGVVSGVPGSVLVGGLEESGAAGKFSAIHPDGTVSTVLGPSTLIGNVGLSTIDAAGRLLWVNLSTSKILVHDQSGTRVLFTMPVEFTDLATDEAGRIFAAGVDGVIRVYAEDGTLINDSFATGLGAAAIAFGPGGAWGRQLFVLQYDTGELKTLSTTGEVATVGTGFDAASYFVFGADGALYVSEFENDRILRIAPSRETLGLTRGQQRVVLAASDGRGGVATQEFTICVMPDPANHDPVIISDPVMSVVGAAVEQSPATSTVVFSTDFENGRPAAVSGAGDVSGVQGFAGLGTLDGRFAGNFLQNATGGDGIPGNHTTITLYDLPEHSNLSIDFLLAIIDSWDGTSTTAGPDYFNLTVDGMTVFREAFDNIGGGASQSYVPAPGEQLGSPARAYRGFNAQHVDSAYDMSLEPLLQHIPHTADSVTIEIYADGAGWQGGTDESWGIDNLSISVEQPAPTYSYQVRAIDPDNDALTYSLVDGPSGMTIDAHTGDIQWQLPIAVNVATDPTATYLRTSQDSARDASVIDLSMLGIQPGDYIQLRANGVWFPHSPPELSVSGLLGVFSGSAILLDSSNQYRVRDAIDAGDDVASPATFYDQLATDIPEDFAIPSDGGVVIQVPADASYLFVTPSDSHFADNSGSLMLELQLASGPVAVRVDDGRGGYDEQTFTVGVAQPGSISGTVFDDGSVVETVAYSQGFENASDPLSEWSLHPVATTPIGNRRFLGELAKQTTALSLSDLPQHDTLKLSFDLFIIRSWDGNLNSNGEQPDVFTVQVEGGSPLLRTTFSNNPSIGQAFPDSYPGSVAHPGRTGSVEQDTLGFVYGNSFVWDTVYHIELEFEHSSPDLVLDFISSGATTNNIANESWGLDNVLITYPGKAGLAGQTIYLDTNRNGRFDPGERTTTTDVAGNYSFDDVPPGEYVVTEAVPAGWLQTAPNGGRYVFELAAGQTLSGIDFGNVQLPATHQNERPSFSTTPGVNPTATVGSLFRYDAWAFDPEGDPLSFDLVSAPAGMAVDPQTGTVVWVPNAGQTGTQHIVLRVQDGNGGVALQPFDLVVSLPNSPPVVTSTPPGPATVGLPYEYQIKAQDAEGDTIAFMLQGSVPDGMTLNPATGLLRWTNPAVAGSQQVTVLVNAANGPDTTYQFTIAVVAAADNRQPVIDSTPPTRARVDQAYAYILAAHDPDGDPLTYVLDAAPTGMTIGQNADGTASTLPGLILWKPTADQLGQQPTVHVTVSDGRGGVVSQEFTVLVLGADQNGPPAIVSTPPSLAVAVGNSYEYRLRAEDPDGDPLVWTLAAAPAGMSIDATTGVLRWSPEHDQMGAAAVTVRVQDSLGTSDQQSFVIQVSCANLPPAIVSRPPTTAVRGEPYVYAIRVSDPENDPIASLVLKTKPAGMDLVDGVIHWTPSAAQAGSTVSVEIEATDAAGGVGRQVYSIFVAATPPNRPPIITSSARQFAAAGGMYEYHVTARDPEGDAVTISLADENKPAAMSIVDGLIHWDVPSGLDGPQPAITIIATDGAGHQALQTFSITVRQNHAPTLAAIADVSTTAGSTFRLDARATDQDGDALSYSISGEEGMTIDRFGRIEWQVPADAAGADHHRHRHRSAGGQRHADVPAHGRPRRDGPAGGPAHWQRSLGHHQPRALLL